MEAIPVQDGRLPAACDAFLAPPGSGDVPGGRAWLETILRHALPAGARPVIALAGRQVPVLLPLLRTGRSLGGLTTPYGLAWRPLAAAGATPDALREAGRDLADDLRLAPPARFEALDAADPSVEALFAGLRERGLRLLRHDHFGNWHEDLAEGTGWNAHVAARPPALRNTIRRKMHRAEPRLVFELVAAPGPALEAGIAAFVAVRAASWKPQEPFPDFDPALMRALAATGELRLGLLRDGAGGPAIAAQYWVVSRERAVVPKLFHVEALRAASPGTVLTAMMVRHLLEVDRVRLLDFGRGDDAYKRLWAASRRQRVGILAIDPRHPAGLAALLRHAGGRLRRRLRGGAAEDAPR
jgi:CelD/BcsL family acetyltransferase involved in cellulose biosynthesis